MRIHLNDWLASILPALSAGAIVATVAFLFLDGMTAVVALASCFLTLGISCHTLQQQVKRAHTQLHTPELRASLRHHAGVFNTVLQDVFPLLEQREADAAHALRGKTESEALVHVRNRQARRLEAAFQTLDQPMFVTDAVLEPVIWTASAAALCRGTSEAESTAETRPDLSQLPAILTLAKETLARGATTQSRTLEIPLMIDGESRPFVIIASNALDENHKPLGVVIACRDASQETAEKTRHAEFVSSVCHELKTPLSSMRAFLEMLIDGDVEEPEEQAELYGFMEIQIDRLTRLINNMLNLARIQSGVIKVEREDCALNDVLHKSLEVVTPMAHDKRIEVISELSDLYLPVHVDRDLFGQAIINLLSNAVKYTPEGGEVRVRSRMLDNSAIIEVRDNGMGIPAEALSKLFQRFYRVPQNNGAAAGTGLGLALVKYIVQDVHNGEVKVESEVNVGSCFSITVPLGHRKAARKHQEPSVTIGH